MIVVFSLATFMAKSYGQTICLVMVAVLLVYWPGILSRKLSKTASVSGRILLIIILIVVKQLVFMSEPKTSIYRSATDRQDIMAIYDNCMNDWPENTSEHYLTTRYANVHVLECGNRYKQPLVMFHAASMGAHSWAENLEAVTENYHVYSIDNPGEGNKSELNDALVFPSSAKEVADFYKELLDELHIDSAVVFGASNGGFIAQNLAYYYPGKVSMLCLFGPMGLTQLTGGSIAMMALSTMYPFQFLRDAVANWALGTSPICHEKYGEWFNAIMKGTIPSIAQPVPMSSEQKKAMDMPVLLFLGSRDKIVGDAGIAESVARDYHDIQIEILESGHLIAVEHSGKVNEIVSAFLSEH